MEYFTDKILRVHNASTSRAVNNTIDTYAILISLTIFSYTIMISLIGIFIGFGLARICLFINDNRVKI